MNWVELILSVEKQWLESAEGICSFFAEGGIYIEDYSDLETGVQEIAHIDLIEEALLQKNRQETLIHLYFEPEQATEQRLALVARLQEAGIPYSWKEQTLKQEDWANQWKEYYHPMRVGKSLVICPSWEETTLEAGEVLLRLDPGMAFGTGNHETTRLCLELMQEYPLGDAVLDVGCGSGILGISALLLGAKELVGVDIDPLAVQTAKENAKENNITKPHTFLEGAWSADGKQYDLLFANIVADVILALTPQFLASLKEGGLLIASGVLNTRAEEVADGLKEAGFLLLDQRQQGDWVAFALTKPKGRE